MLQKMGYTVFEAKNGEEALNKASENSFSFIILDLTIPGGMGGKDTVKELRKNNQNIPIFASSGYSKDPVFSDPESYGFTDCIRKPYRNKTLSELLDQYMDN